MQQKFTVSQQNMIVDWQPQLKGKREVEKDLPVLQYHLHQQHKPGSIINSFKEMNYTCIKKTRKYFIYKRK